MSLRRTPAPAALALLLTAGCSGELFSYQGDGKGLLNVFHDERAEIDEDTDPSALAGTTNWRVWAMDFDAMTGAPIEEIDWSAGAASDFVVGDRTYLFVPSADYASTALWEVVDGHATHAFTVAGWSYQFFQVR